MGQFKDFGNAFVESVTDIVGGAGDNFKANTDIEKAKAVVILNNANIANEQAKLVRDQAEANHKLLRQVSFAVIALVAFVIVLNFAKKYIK